MPFEIRLHARHCTKGGPPAACARNTVASFTNAEIVCTDVFTVATAVRQNDAASSAKMVKVASQCSPCRHVPRRAGPQRGAAVDDMLDALAGHDALVVAELQKPHLVGNAQRNVWRHPGDVWRPSARKFFPPAEGRGVAVQTAIHAFVRDVKPAVCSAPKTAVCPREVCRIRLPWAKKCTSGER